MYSLIIFCSYVSFAMAIGTPGWSDNASNKVPKYVSHNIHVKELTIVAGTNLYMKHGEIAHIRGDSHITCTISCGYCNYRILPGDSSFNYPATLGLWPGYVLYNGGGNALSVTC